MKITGISAPFGLDLRQLDRDINSAAERLVQFGKSDAITDAANLSLSAKQTGPASGEDQTRGIDGQMAGLSGLGSQLAKAMAPLQGIGGRISQEFDRVGGTIVSLARRIDAAMRFPAFDAALGAISSGLTGVAASSARAFGVFVSAATAATRKAWQFHEDLGMIAAGASVALGVIAGRFLGIVGGISLAAGAAVKLGQTFFRVTNYLGSLGDVAGKTFTQLFHISTLNVFKNTENGARGATAALDHTTAAARNLGRELLAAFGIFGLTYKVAEFFKGAIKGASDLGETLSKTQVRFGEATGDVVKYADTMAKTYGIVKQETLDAAAGFGGLGKSLANLTGNELTAFSIKMTQLAADINSQENLGGGFQQAAKGLKILLSGEQSDSMKEMGAILLDDSVKAYAFAHGISKSAKEVSEAEKVMARAAMVMEKVRDAQGDLARTADSAANQFRKAGGGVKNLQVMIGELLLPAVTTATIAFNEFLATVIEVFEANKERITSFATSLKTAFDGIGVLIRNFGTFWQMAQLRVGAFVLNAIAWVETLPVNFGRVTAWVASNWSKLLEDLVAMAGAFFANMLTNATNFGTALWSALKGEGFNFQFTPLLEGFRATADALPEMMKPALVDIQADLDRLNGEIQDREAKRTKAMAKAVPKMDDPTKAAAKKDSKVKVADMAEAGSKEAWKAIAVFQNRGAGKDKDMQETATATKDTAKNTALMVEAMRDMGRNTIPQSFLETMAI